MIKNKIFQLITIILMTISSFQAFSQSAAITREVNIIKEKAIGLTLLDEGGSNTNPESAIAFDKEYWSNDYEYIIFAVVDCYDLCDIVMKFYDYETGQLHILNPNITTNASLKGGRFKFKKTKNIKGKFYVYSDNPYSNYYVYTLLFSRKIN